MTYYCVLVDRTYGFYNIFEAFANNKQEASTIFLNYFKNNINFFPDFLSVEPEDFEDSANKLKAAKTLEDWNPEEIAISMVETFSGGDYIGFVITEYDEVPEILPIEADSEMDAIDKFMFNGFRFLYNIEKKWDHSSVDYWLYERMVLGRLIIEKRNTITKIC